ncbi:MAG: site-specific integrase [Gemmataceae bacterium]|nr:site-specific integrase [Gemmataceae bacterium]
MPRSRNPVPSYLHHWSGKARAVWSDATGARHCRVLPGPFDSPESRSAFARLVAELAASPAVGARAAAPTLTVNELLLAYLDHAERHYRRADGRPSDEVRQVKAAGRVVRELYGLTPAAEFGPLALKAVRERFVAAGWGRKTVNARVERVRRAFKWAASEQLVGESVYHALKTVDGLRKGRTAAPEPKPVRPVEDATVEAVLPFLTRHVRGLVEFQRLTGCRPSEACGVRRADIDTGGAVWLYRPVKHKTDHLGHTRTIAVGPRAQALLREFFTPDMADHLFSPRRAVVEQLAARAADRKTPRYPSHERHNAARRVARAGRPRGRTPADHYTRLSYEKAIARACDRAFPPPGELAQREGESKAKWRARLTAEQRADLKRWQKAHRWAPNQLRHAHGTRVRKAFGIEAAGAMLGHQKMSATEVYAERDAALAQEVAAKLG